MYPRYYGQHFSDFSSLGKIEKVCQLRDFVMVKTEAHTLTYRGVPFGSISGQGWKLVKAIDNQGNEVDVESLVDGDDTDTTM